MILAAIFPRFISVFFKSWIRLVAKHWSYQLLDWMFGCLHFRCTHRFCDSRTSQGQSCICFPTDVVARKRWLCISGFLFLKSNWVVLSSLQLTLASAIILGAFSNYIGWKNCYSQLVLAKFIFFKAPTHQSRSRKCVNDIYPKQTATCTLPNCK